MLEYIFLLVYNVSWIYLLSSIYNSDSITYPTSTTRVTEVGTTKIERNIGIIQRAEDAGLFYFILFVVAIPFLGLDMLFISSLI